MSHDTAVLRIEHAELVFQARQREAEAEAAVTAATEAYQQVISDAHRSRSDAVYALFALTRAKQTRALCQHDLEQLLIEMSYETGVPR